MSEIRHFIVERTQHVKVMCDTPENAIRIANAAFDKETHDFRAIGGIVRRGPHTIGLEAIEVWPCPPDKGKS